MWLPVVWLAIMAAAVAETSGKPADAVVLADGGHAADRAIRALDMLDRPYRRGGTSPESGFDCSGLVLHVFRSTAASSLPRTAHDLFRLDLSGRAEKVERAAIAAGDLLFFRIGRLGQRIDHVGIALGDGRFVHAPASGGVVRIDSLDMPYWSRHFAGARRLPAIERGAINVAEEY
ncbi:MAG: C40 family peptidase [Pseudomonadota bacterium]